MIEDKVNRLFNKISIPGLVFLVLLAYLPVIYNGFVSWDDEVYIVNNPLIQSLNWNNFQHIFSTSFEGHYHPFTLLSLSIDYQLFGIHPLGFHLHNLILHILNTVLVFFMVRKLSGSDLVSWITAAFFGLHPMHVEAVAWATARKDVLYSFYFLLALYSYLQRREKKRFWLVISLLAFIFALFSKGQAVFLPLCLILFSYLRGESLFSWSNWKDKIPYLALALAFGIIALFAQRETGYMGESVLLPAWWKVILTACLSFWMYLFKILLPVSLSAYYPVPDLGNGTVMALAIVSLLLTVALIYLIYKWYNKKRLMVVGILFFVVNIFIFLRWIPVSNYIIADRYTYVSAIGLFFIAAHGISRLHDQYKPGKLWIFLLTFCIIAYGSLTYMRVEKWKDSLTLVDDILKKYPDVYPALNTRGNELLDKGDKAGALADFNHAIAVQPQHSRGWANRGSLYFKDGKPLDALKDMNQAVSLDMRNPRLLNNRGLMFDAIGKNDEALADFNAALQSDPYFAEAYNNRGMELARTGKPEDALKDFNKALEINPSLSRAYANRGKAKNQTADFRGAVGDLEIALKNGLTNPIVYFDLGFSWYNLKDFYKAKMYFDKALTLRPDFVNALTYRGYTQFNDGDYQAAVADLTKAISLDTTNPIAYGMRGMALVRINKISDACSDFARAEAMGLVQVKKEREKYCGK